MTCLQFFLRTTFCKRIAWLWSLSSEFHRITMVFLWIYSNKRIWPYYDGSFFLQWNAQSHRYRRRFSNLTVVCQLALVLIFLFKRVVLRGFFFSFFLHASSSMAKDGLGHGARTERAIIDALLKISEIVQKTEAIRERQKPTNATKRPRKLVGDGDTDQQRVPVPPPMRTLDSQLSTMNHRPVQQPSNCNRATNPRSKQGAAKDSHRSSEQSKSKPLSSCYGRPRHVFWV